MPEITQKGSVAAISLWPLHKRNGWAKKAKTK